MKSVTPPCTCPAWLAGFLMLLIVGCKSESDPATVTPPPREKINRTTPNDPPGGMELPPGEIPDSDIDADSAESNGLMMPKASARKASGTNDSSAQAKIQYASWDEIRDAVTSTGRLTVVDVWSTVCEPCLKEFPGLVKLHRSVGDQVQCVSVNVDYDGRKTRPPEIYEPEIVSFLTSSRADFVNYICNTPSEDFFSQADLDSIPAVLIYNQDGKLIKTFVDTGGGFDYEKDVAPFVQSKLAESL